MEGQVKDYQMSAWLMAICLNGMTDEETAALTAAIVQSGAVMDWSTTSESTGSPHHRVDKHSTGGVGDKVSLILAPLVASFGLAVPLMAGRGLGHTGGTIDKLESIPGFRTQYTSEDLKQLLQSTEHSTDGEPLNVAIISQSQEMCPADKRMYALRDVTGTVRSLPLQTSSIMSKKIASRPNSLVLDVKFGKGSFNKDVKEALELAKGMIQTGELCGIRSTALLTRMDEPLGCSVGNWLEVRECIDIMTSGTRTTEDTSAETNNMSKDLIELTLALAGQMLVHGGKAETLRQGVIMARDHLLNGKAWHKFRQMVMAQGGDISVIDSPENYVPAKYSVSRYGLPDLALCFTLNFTILIVRLNSFYAIQSQVISPCSGNISSIDSMILGSTAVYIGAGRNNVEGSVDFAAGILLRMKTGMIVQKGDVLAEIYSERDEVMEFSVQRVLDAFSFSNEHVIVPPLMSHIVDKDGVAEFDQTILLGSEK